MNIADAWYALGTSWDSVVGRIISCDGKEARVAEAEKMLAEARHVAKRLLGLHHPDKNPGDGAASERFRLIGEAIQTIEDDTKRLRQKFEESKMKPEKDGFIKISL